MNDLGAALALLLDARNRYSTVRAVIRSVFTPLPGAGDGQGEGSVDREEYVTRIWLATPDRVREEIRKGRAGWSIGIRDGAIWWAVDADGSRHSNVDEPDVGSDIGGRTKLLFDPAPLVGALRLELVGETELLGRRAIRMRGTRRSKVLTTNFELEELEPEDELELDVDAERGVLLHRRSEHRGHEWFLQEALDIAFDEEFDPVRFDYAHEMRLRGRWRRMEGPSSGVIGRMHLYDPDAPPQPALREQLAVFSRPKGEAGQIPEVLVVLSDPSMRAPTAPHHEVDEEVVEPGPSGAERVPFVGRMFSGRVELNPEMKALLEDMSRKANEDLGSDLVNEGRLLLAIDQRRSL